MTVIGGHGRCPFDELGETDPCKAGLLLLFAYILNLQEFWVGDFPRKLLLELLLLFEGVLDLVKFFL